MLISKSHPFQYSPKVTLYFSFCFSVKLNDILGPQIDKFSHCHVLYDIPLIIRNLLEEISPNYRGISRKIFFIYKIGIQYGTKQIFETKRMLFMEHCMTLNFSDAIFFDTTLLRDSPEILSF